MLYDLYPGLFTLQYKGYLMVGMELIIANKNSECGSMPFLVYVIFPYPLEHFELSSCFPSIVDLNVGKTPIFLHTSDCWTGLRDVTYR